MGWRDRKAGATSFNTIVDDLYLRIIVNRRACLHEADRSVVNAALPAARNAAIAAPSTAVWLAGAAAKAGATLLTVRVKLLLAVPYKLSLAPCLRH